MFEKFIPDMYQKSIYTINYKKLKSLGIKCLLFDVDNTLVPHTTKKMPRKIKDLIERLKDMGFKVILISNGRKSRLKKYKDYLEVDCSAVSMKPLSFKFNKILKLYKFTENEVAIIGDQLLTDILGGNVVGITTILINPISLKDHQITKISRIIEKIIMRTASKKKLFKRGSYYE